MKILLALGANLPSLWGNPAETLSKAIGLLSERISPDTIASRFFVTPAFPPGSGPDFLNAALSLQSDLSPQDVLTICHEVESEARRERGQRWGPRTLDIDVIGCDAIVHPDIPTQTAWMTLPKGEQGRRAPAELILPHPRVQDRAFVLVPLAEVAPDWRHPVLGQTVAEMLAACPVAERQAIVPFEQGNPLVKHSHSP